MIASTDWLVTSRLRGLDYDLPFEPVCYLVSVPNVIVVNNASPYWALADLLNVARAKPGDLTLASVGPASSLQIAFEKLKRAANVEMTFVAYPGAAPAINALLAQLASFERQNHCISMRYDFLVTMDSSNHLRRPTNHVLVQ